MSISIMSNAGVADNTITRLANEVASLSASERHQVFELILRLSSTSSAKQPQIASREDEHPRQAPLTVREEQVLTLVVGGFGNKEVAEILGVSRRTIELHRSRLMGKLCAKNTADLCRIYATMNESVIFNRIDKSIEQ